MTNINLKEVLKDKFWIVEDKGTNIGTLSLHDEKYMLSSSTGTEFFDTKQQLGNRFRTNVSWTDLDITQQTPLERVVHGFPTSCDPYNSIFDVKRRLPLFTKSNKSKSLYCAGYYIIRFEKGWVKSFCPKLITIERYESKGPFKTEFIMRQELSNAK
jgi:hypothetical protein